MTVSDFYKALKEKFPFEPTTSQDITLQKLAAFVLDDAAEEIFLLKGYAGTGKTTLIGTLVNSLWKAKKKFSLTAPTGRAAKVITNYSNQEASTIHRKIYLPKNERGTGVTFSLKQNKQRDTIFLVDEASMISDVGGDSKLFENGSLLDDLVQYVYSGKGCKLILIGDTAQLPPVKMQLSPALDEKLLRLQYHKEIVHVELNEVVRQSLQSDILRNATRIREYIEDELYDAFHFSLTGKKDLERLSTGQDIMDAIEDAYRTEGHEETTFIVRSNKRANQYNVQIRSRILFKEEEVAVGDYLMVVKNNYFWVKPTSDAGFIANGDLIEILQIYSFKELYGFRFAKVSVRMVDYPKMASFDTTILLDTLTSNSPSLTYEESNALYLEVQKDYADEKSNYKKYMGVKKSPYFNALQVKFSYAVTCHKSQGGQWSKVFVEQPYLPNGMDKDYLRWLYTAITRAKDKLYLIGFKDDMFEEV
ncbi:ATP-binding domain-containing protein [Gangjinia marincola]|uniref:ATP-binding domain-containing protein n=1 Tax=Gangjinia marincola TaxID=578463 RepID=A0ABN1MD49_9FLAO